MIEFIINENGSMERVYKDKEGNVIHEGDIIEYPNGDQKEVYLTEDGELGIDATNPNWILTGRACPCEYGIYPFNDEELKEIKVLPTYTCCICGEKFIGYGNNPAPVILNLKGRCCDKCNSEIVIPTCFANVRTISSVSLK